MSEQEKIKHPNNFVDPYGHIERKNKGRTTIDVALEVRADLNSLYPKKGCLQTTINILLEKLRNELKANGLDTYAPEVYEYAIGNCRIILGGFDEASPNPRVPRITTRKRANQSKSNSGDQKPSGHDRRRTKRVALSDEGVADSADSP